MFKFIEIKEDEYVFVPNIIIYEDKNYITCYITDINFPYEKTLKENEYTFIFTKNIIYADNNEINVIFKFVKDDVFRSIQNSTEKNMKVTNVDYSKVILIRSKLPKLYIKIAQQETFIEKIKSRIPKILTFLRVWV